MLKGVEADTVFDAGAYASSSPDYAEMMAHKLLRLYRVPRYRHHGRVAYTTTPVAGGARAYGAPEICAAMEIAHGPGGARGWRATPWSCACAIWSIRTTRTRCRGCRSATRA